MLDIRQRTGYLFLTVMVAQVILVSAQVQSKSGVRVLQLVALGLFSHVEGATAAGVRDVRGVWGNYFALRGVRAENDSLRRQVADLQVHLQEEHALAARSAKLQELLALRNQATLPTLAAEVIAGNPDPVMRTITIDRGSADGVQADMSVIAPAGVVGRVIGPTARHAARVQLIIDRDAAAGALTERTRAGGMVIGVDADPPLRLDLVSNLADVRAGDAVIASGVDGIFPKGYPIGRIAGAQRGAGLYWT
ncbi:MAG: rod shape-determining protein MreC, partial [Vicinamibacterales bacterium]